MNWLNRIRNSSRWKTIQSRFQDRLARWSQSKRPGGASSGIEKLQAFLKTSLFARLMKFLTLALCMLFLSDLTVLGLEALFPEDPAASERASRADRPSPRRVNDYAIVWQRNLFDHRGLLPGDESPERDEPEPADPDGAVESSLPYDLVGVLLLKEDSSRSIATLRHQSENEVHPVTEGDAIPDVLRVLRVESKRVVFTNLQNSQAEYIEIPEDLAFERPSVANNEGIKQISENRVRVSRSEVEAQLQDLSQVLTQARAIPHFEDGEASGYKITQIVPDSVYDQIGLEDQDILKSVNGEMVDDPSKAMELMNHLSEENEIALEIERDGENTELVVDIN